MTPEQHAEHMEMAREKVQIAAKKDVLGRLRAQDAQSFGASLTMESERLLAGEMPFTATVLTHLIALAEAWGAVKAWRVATTQVCGFSSSIHCSKKFGARGDRCFFHKHLDKAEAAYEAAWKAVKSA